MICRARNPLTMTNTQFDRSRIDFGTRTTTILQILVHSGKIHVLQKLIHGGKIDWIGGKNDQIGSYEATSAVETLVLEQLKQIVLLKGKGG